MKTLLSAVLAAGLLSTMPLANAQQDAVTPAPTQPEAGAAAPAAPAGEAVAPDAAGGHGGEAEEHHTVHYPLKHPASLDWSFAGMFGHWDVAQLQRGLKVYKEVCSACHSMNLVAMRSLGALGYSEEQVKAFAAEYTVQDGPNGDGEMFERKAIPSDHFPAPYPNPEAAAAANNGAAPPDLSLIAKGRAVERGFPTFIFDIFTQYAESGPDYVHGLLTGYGQEPAADVVIQPGTYYNPYFISGPALAMPPPLSADQVTYDDGTQQTVDQYARDVSAFLMWAAEPHLVERKQTGLIVILFLAVFAGMLYIVKRRVWDGIAH
ncbi:cytochrome c1 [Mangrovicella endophytica]|uniref:cytochrome c1 n=1 Tax=Mangrovicella endophytica TaxID=2066697 RepID=UPI000C9EB3E3